MAVFFYSLKLRIRFFSFFSHFFHSYLIGLQTSEVNVAKSAVLWLKHRKINNIEAFWFQFQLLRLSHQ